MDKVGIILAIAITTVPVEFTATGGLGAMSNIHPNVEKISPSVSVLEKEALVVKKVTKDIEQAAKEAKQTTEKVQEIAKEAVSAKLPAKFVSIPKGTSMPGCDKVNLCYDPQHVTVFVGGEILWRNDDSSAHTVTSGDALTGPDGNLDSSLLRNGQTFSHMFDKSGEYRYFCMIHPWATGSVIVN